MESGFDFAIIWQSLPDLLAGTVVTIQLTALTVLGGIALALPLGILRASRLRWVSRAIWCYTYFFRGTPTLIQLFLIYYGLAEFKIIRSSALWPFLSQGYWCCVLAFTLNTAAYQAEILRGAIESVPRGQWEGATSLGLSRCVTLRKVILPQAMIVALRPYANELVLMIKGSAIVALITIFDLMGETRRAYSRSFDFQTYLWAAIIYLALVETLRHLVDWIERRITRHLFRH